MTADLLSPMTAEQRRLVRREVVRFGHALADTGLFGDEALAQLTDLHPREATRVITRRPDGSPRDGWLSGRADEATGAAVLKAVREGTLQVRLDGVMTCDPACRLVHDRLMDEFRAITGVLPLDVQASIVISSPRLATPLVIEADEAATLNVRGDRVLYAYPSGPQAALPWTPAREDEATPVMLRVGQAAYWTPRAPVRTVNGEDLNVSVLLTFQTLQSRLVALARRAMGQPSATVMAEIDATPRFDLTSRGLVWREGLAPDWAPAPKKTVRRKPAAAPRMRKAA